MLGFGVQEEVVLVGAVREDDGADDGGGANGVADVVKSVGIIVFALAAVVARSLSGSLADRDGYVWACICLDGSTKDASWKSQVSHWRAHKLGGHADGE